MSVCLSMCVWCVYACISHVCVCVRACACVRACVHARLCACVRGRAYTFSHPLPSSPSRPLSAWHAYTHTRVCLCVHTHVHTCRMGCSMEHCQGGGREQCGGVWLRSCRTVGQSFFLSLSRSHSLAHSLSRARSLSLSLALSLSLSRARALACVHYPPHTHMHTGNSGGEAVRRTAHYRYRYELAKILRRARDGRHRLRRSLRT